MKSLKLLLRFLTVGGLVLLLLIPLLMIRGVIQDRERYRAMAEVRVSQSMAGAQQVVGPLRVVPWREERLVNALNEDGKPEVRRDVKEGYLLQSPATLAVDGHLQPGERRIGLYTVNVYEWKAAMKAREETRAKVERRERTKVKRRRFQQRISARKALCATRKPCCPCTTGYRYSNSPCRMILKILPPAF